jgi:hypothetical protein
MPVTDMLGESVEFTDDNWRRLCSLSSYLRAVESWGAGARLDVPRAFLCQVAAARRAFAEAASFAAANDEVWETKRALAASAIERVTSDGTAMVYADTLDMVDSLREMGTLLAPRPTQWHIPECVAYTVIGRAVDPLGVLSLSQLAVVAALCLKQSDRAFDEIAVSMEHLRSVAFGVTFDASGELRVETGAHSRDWAPSMLFVIGGTAQVCFTLASFQKQSSGHYHLREPAMHDLLGKMQAPSNVAVSAFVRRLACAIARGVDRGRRSWPPAQA